MFSWFTDNWKTIASVAASIVVGVAVTALVVATAPVSFPLLAAIAIGGFAGGVAGYLVNQWLNDEPVSVKEALWQGTVSAVVSVATLGLGRVLAPVASKVLAPVVSQVAPEAAVPFVTRVASNGVSFATAGATTGAGAQVANNALNDRPLTENVVPAATQGFVLGGTFTVASEVAPVLVRRAPLVLEPQPVDPVTRTTMDSLGINRDTIVYRVTEPRWVQDGTISGNPRSMATVRDPYNLVENPWKKLDPSIDLPPVPRRVQARELGPSLNVAVEDPSLYAKPGMVRVGIRVGDLLDRGGKIYPDDGAVVTGIKPLIVTFDGSVPVVSVEPVVPKAPSPTKGFNGVIEDAR